MLHESSSSSGTILANMTSIPGKLYFKKYQSHQVIEYCKYCSEILGE